MPPKRIDPAAWLTLIAERAPTLREAGVRSLSIDGVTIELAPYDPPAPTERRSQNDEPRDLLDDRETYGIPEGAAMPGFTRPRREEPA